ncbi:MAG: ATP-binding protein [Anaerolineae bacterium]|nr:ATP-binding protein [Anaerolineae bacterium]
MNCIRACFSSKPRLILLMSNECDLVVPGRSDQLDTIREFIGRVARQAGLDEQQVFRVQLSVDEACANIVEHAYENMQGGDIVLKCQWDDDKLTITIQDFGEPFDPERVPPPNLDNDLESRTPGGLGLYFMYQMMDKVYFEFDQDRGNTLTMVKLLKPPPQDIP